MGTEQERTAAGFLAHRGLIVVTCAGAMAEAGLLIVVAPTARTLAPQVTAQAPLAIFHDLRWLYSAERPWPDFVALFAGLVLARSLVNAVLVRLAWPSRATAPSPRVLLHASLTLTLVGSLLMSPIVSLAFGVAIVPFSWPFLAVLPALLLIALPLSHGGVVRNWWRRLPPPAAMGWLLADFAAMSAAAAVTGRLSATAAVPIAGLAGVVNARAWYGMTAAALRPRAPSRLAATRLARRIPAAPLAVTAAIALVIAVTRVSFLIGVPPAQVRPHPAAAPLVLGSSQLGQLLPGTSRHHPLPRRPVLEVPGFGSSCCSGSPLLASIMPDTLVERFSYRGLSASGKPRPYGAAASNLPLSVLGDRIATQVRQIHAETGRLVNIVAESEGTLGVDAMLAQHPHVPVGSVALLSPIVAPGRQSYELATGSRLVPGSELQAVVWFVGGLSPFGTSGAQTLINSVNRVGARFAAAAARHHPLRLMAFVPLADALTLPVCRLPPDVVVVPAFHGELLGDPAVLQLVRDFLLHRTVRGPANMRTTAEIFAAAGTAWRMPETSTPSPPCQRS